MLVLLVKSGVHKRIQSMSTKIGNIMRSLNRQDISRISVYGCKNHVGKDREEICCRLILFFFQVSLNDFIRGRGVFGLSVPPELS